MAHLVLLPPTYFSAFSLPVVLEDLLAHPALSDLPEVKAAYQRVLIYSLLAGRRFRAHSVLRTFNALAGAGPGPARDKDRDSGRDVDADRLAASASAAVVALCAELMLRLS